MKLLIVAIYLFVFASYGFCQKGQPLDCDAFCKLISQEENALILDVRVIEMYKKNRIKDAVWVGVKDSLKCVLKHINLDKPLLLYCEIGKRSKECSSWLKKTGYTHVYELKGGLKQWIKNGYPVDNTPVKD